jgi:hypothetical protein
MSSPIFFKVLAKSRLRTHPPSTSTRVSCEPTTIGSSTSGNLPSSDKLCRFRKRLAPKPTQTCMLCVVIGSGLAHNDSRFILVQEKCPTSSRGSVGFIARAHMLERVWGVTSFRVGDCSSRIGSDLLLSSYRGPSLLKSKGVSIIGYLKVEES